MNEHHNPSPDTAAGKAKPRDPTLSLLLTLVIAITPAAAHAQTSGAAPATCSTAMDTALPAAWSAWTQPEAVTAAPTPATQPELSLGHAYKVQYAPIATVQYPVALKKVVPNSFGGLFMLTIDKTGIYTVALDGDGWIGMVKDGQELRSASHAHGPDCSTIHKLVDFQLDPGHYTLQISNTAKDSGVVEVVAK